MVDLLLKFLRSNATLNIENIDKYCFLRSILASLHPCISNHPNRVSNYTQYFNEVNINGFDFTNGFRCSDVHKFNEINNLSVNIFEIIFYQNQNKWRHKSIPFDISKNESDRVVDLNNLQNSLYSHQKIKCILGRSSQNFYM